MAGSLGGAGSAILAPESLFFESEKDKEAIHSARHKYPRRGKPGSSATGTGRDLANPMGPEPEEEAISRRIMGFGLGFEKIFATTSIKLPVSAYTIFVELHTLHIEQCFSRCFNGLHTIYDLKKWIFEVLQVPIDAYEISYAEPGKAALTDQLRLLTTHDSLDTRTLATTRAVHQFYKGIPGAHSIDDNGVTRIYVRLKCGSCGQILNSLQKCQRRQTLICHGVESEDWDPKPVDSHMERRWHRPDPSACCMYDTRGYEMYCAARARGASSSSEIARIYISMGQEPTKKLKLGRNVLMSQ